MSYRLSEAGYEALLTRLRGKPPPPPVKQNKYRNRPVVIDGNRFASKLEGAVYTDLRWQFRAGLITEPLLQVPFSLGEHYGKLTRYIADFAFVNLKDGQLVVADAKGACTPEYLRKKRTFQRLYCLEITEYHRSKR